MTSMGFVLTICVSSHAVPSLVSIVILVGACIIVKCISPLRVIPGLPGVTGGRKCGAVSVKGWSGMPCGRV